MIATLQIYIDGKWTVAGTFDSRGGIAAGGYLEYDQDFVFAHVENSPECRMGLRYPVNFELYQESRWPAFLLDILPTGAGRRVWARRLGLTDGEGADWQLLLNGAGNPPGNLRVAEAVIPPAGSHPGFTKEEVVEKNAIVKSLHRHIDQEEAVAFLAEHRVKVENLPKTMQECGVEGKVIQLVARRCGEIATDLRDAVRGAR